MVSLPDIQVSYYGHGVGEEFLISGSQTETSHVRWGLRKIISQVLRGVKLRILGGTRGPWTPVRGHLGEARLHCQSRATVE